MNGYETDIAIVGGGILGAATAVALLNEGREVAIVEKQSIGGGAAVGSAGYLHEGEIFPLGSPELLRELPHLLFDPLSPLVFRTRDLPRLLGWGLRFALSARPASVQNAIDGLASLNRLAIEELVRLAEAANASELVVRNGGLRIFKSEAAQARSTRDVAILNAMSIPAQLIDGAAVRALEPAVSTGVLGAIFYPESAHVVDLGELGARVARLVSAKASVIPEHTERLTFEKSRWILRLTSGAVLRAKTVVVCTGAWSAKLLQSLGYRVPLASARGYHLMLPDAHVKLDHPIIFQEPHFAGTMMRGGLRLAGTMEFANPTAPQAMQRADMLFGIAQDYLPAIRRDGATRWMGVRSCTPDSLPLIGKALRHEGLYYAFGHGHLGLTQSAISARCIADLAAGRQAPIDLSRFNLARFN